MIRAAAFATALTTATLALGADAPKPTVVRPAKADSKSKPRFERVSAINGTLSLGQAIELGLKQNPDLLRALQEIERTRGQVLEVRAQALPHLVGTADYTQQDPQLLEQSSGSGSNARFTDSNGNPIVINNGGSGSSNSSSGDKSWRAAIEVRQLLYSGGQVKAALKIAKYTEDQAYYLLRDTVDHVIANVRSQFYRVILNRKLITVAEESIRLLEDQLKDQQNRFEAGTVPRFNVLQAEVALANSQPDLIRAKNDYLLSELDLSRTLGLEASKSSTGKPSFEAVGDLHAIERRMELQTALKVAREKRPSLMAQQQNILSEEQQINVAKAGLKPTITANGGWEFHNSRRSDDLSREVNGWYYGVNGEWAIFDGFATKGKVVQAQARLTSAKITYADAVLQVELEVQTAHARVQEARELLASQVKVVEQADEALRLSRERLAAGAGTQLDVLNAQVALTRARTTQQQALYDFNVAVAEFERATATDTVYDNTFVDPRAAAAAPAAAKPASEKRSDKRSDK